MGSLLSSSTAFSGQDPGSKTGFRSFTITLLYQLKLTTIFLIARNAFLSLLGEPAINSFPLPLSLTILNVTPVSVSMERKFVCPFPITWPKYCSGMKSNFFSGPFLGLVFNWKIEDTSITVIYRNGHKIPHTLTNT